MKNKKEWVLPNLKEAQKRTQQQAMIQRSLFEIPEQMRSCGNGKKFFLRTYGCQANERDGETLAGILTMMGFTQCDTENDADVILLNTCAVRQNAEDKVFGEIGKLKALKMTNPDLILGICGCMPQEEEVVEKILKTYHQVDLIFGTHNLHRLPVLLYNAILSKEKVIEVYSKEGDVIENLPAKRFGKFKAWVNIMYGCDKFCTYCIVPYTRGKERSRSIEDIVAEVKELKEQGFKEVTLLGQNVNAYGKDLYGERVFGDLMAKVAETGIERVRFTTSHPWDFTKDMVDVIAKYDNIMPFIHLPVQSGNNEILKIMGRRYTKEQYKELFDYIVEKIPNCVFSTDIIVGFPNETEEQFQETMDMVDYCKYDNAYTFIYSPREGTPAARMEDNVPFEVKQDRLQRLQDKVSGYAKYNNEQYIGKVLKVMTDGLSKRNDQVYAGYSEENKLVNFTASHAEPGEIVEVEILEARSWTLNGRMIEK